MLMPKETRAPPPEVFACLDQSAGDSEAQLFPFGRHRGTRNFPKRCRRAFGCLDRQRSQRPIRCHSDNSPTRLAERKETRANPQGLLAASVRQRVLVSPKLGRFDLFQQGGRREGQKKLGNSRRPFRVVGSVSGIRDAHAVTGDDVGTRAHLSCEGIYCAAMSSGILLSVLKVISEGLTAGFGILGLVTEFKDEKTTRITRNGKIALGGIVISFIVSSAITAVENVNSRAAERAHAAETRRLSRPLGLLRVQVDYSLKPEPKDAASLNLKEISEWTSKHETRDVRVGNFPSSLRTKLPSHGSIAAGISIEIYAKAFSCPKVASLDRDPDLLVNTARSRQDWQYFANLDGGYLFVTRGFNTAVVKEAHCFL
jgi:hypothetical protein